MSHPGVRMENLVSGYGSEFRVSEQGSCAQGS